VGGDDGAHRVTGVFGLANRLELPEPRILVADEPGNSPSGQALGQQRCCELVQTDSLAYRPLREAHVQGFGNALYEQSTVDFRHGDVVIIFPFGHRPSVEGIVSFRDGGFDGLAVGDASRQVGNGDQIKGGSIASVPEKAAELEARLDEYLASVTMLGAP